MQDAAQLIETTLAGLGYELVDFERSSRGLLRVLIDKPAGIGVEDCSTVSNHLSRVFLVENIDYDRLEISSPGLDRPLKKLADFQRFLGALVSMRLHKPIEGRKRFNARISAVNGEAIALQIEAELLAKKPDHKAAKPSRVVRDAPVVTLTVTIADIDRARLVPII